MRKYIFLLCLSVLAFSRENPFAPVGDFKEGEVEATNISSKYVKFNKKAIQMPSNSRVLKYVKVGYQALDGSVQEKLVNINESIDWHNLLILTTKNEINLEVASKTSLEDTLKSEPAIPQAPDEGIENSHVDIKQLSEDTEQKPKKTEKEIIKKEIPKVVVTKEVQKPKVKEEKIKLNELKTFKFNKHLSFSIDGKMLIVNTKDKLIRDFLVSKPYKIVLDFKRDLVFGTKKIDINQAPFKNVLFGQHKGYYRAVFLLDGQYPYNIIKENGVITIELR